MKIMFLDAVNELKNGNKVRRITWPSDTYVVMENGQIIGKKACNGDIYITGKDLTGELLWELYIEKKSFGNLLIGSIFKFDNHKYRKILIVNGFQPSYCYNAIREDDKLHFFGASVEVQQ